MIANSKSILLTLVLTSWTLICLAQVNPPEQSFTLIPGQIFETVIESGYRQANPLLENGFDFSIVDGSFDEPSANGSNKTMISFQVSEEFVGKRTSLIVEYTAGPMEFSPIEYTVLHFYVTDSHIETKHDYKSIDVGDANVSINVLDNDSSTHGGLQISELAYVSGNIEASISNNRLVVSSTNNQGGMGYVNYIATNIKGASALGTATICILNNGIVESEATLQYITSNQTPLTILLPISDLDIEGDGPNLGDAEIIGDDVIEYTPNPNIAGTDLFSVKSGNIIRHIEVQVYEPSIDGGSVKDDLVYTEIGNPLQFNIFDNDINIDASNLQSISNGNGFTHLGDGNVIYEPNPNFVGSKQFEYTINKGVTSETGIIKIVVGGFFPEPLSSYKLVTKKNTPFILDYAVPIDDFSFGASEVPAQGALAILGNAGSYDYGCGSALGENMIVYTPNANFVGNDQFTLTYMVSDQYEQSLLIEVEVIDSDDCGCAGSDCVWPGDMNNDGKVFITDLLTLGHNFGVMGNAREEGSAWIANKGDNWGGIQIENGTDQKYVDANGDGTINIDDVGLIKQNYNRYHNLVSHQVLTIKDYPFIVIPSASEVDSGDWLELEIHLGSDEYPVLDVHGLAYTLHIDPAVYDSASLRVQYYDQPWFGNNSPTIHMHVQPVDGRVDIGSTRTTGNTTSGKGIIHKLGIIIEEDIDGVDPGQRELDFPITISNISYTNSIGETIALGDVETAVTLNLTQEDNMQIESESSELFAFPNPTVDKVNLHLNGRDIIENVEIFDLSGKLMHVQKNLNTDKLTLDVANYNEGMYVVRATTLRSVISKRIQVIRD